VQYDGQVPQRTPRPLPPGQAQRDWEKIWEDDLDSGLVRAGRRKALSAASAGPRDAVVQERSQEPIDSDRRPRGGRRVPSLSRDGCEHCQIRHEKFREKYGAKDVKRYYSKFDVAVVVKTGAINGLLAK
jgi:hypothetical protein